VTLHFSAVPANRTILFYDIVGASAAPEDGHIQNQGGAAPSTRPLRSARLADHHPASANGLTIAALTMGIGPVQGFATGAPSGAIYDFVFHTGQVDSDRMDKRGRSGSLLQPRCDHRTLELAHPERLGHQLQLAFRRLAAHFK